jgi:hypothetical protein
MTNPGYLRGALVTGQGFHQPTVPRYSPAQVTPGRHLPGNPVELVLPRFVGPFNRRSQSPTAFVYKAHVFGRGVRETGLDGGLVLGHAVHQVFGIPHLAFGRALPVTAFAAFAPVLHGLWDHLGPSGWRSYSGSGHQCGRCRAENAVRIRVNEQRTNTVETNT